MAFFRMLDRDGNGKLTKAELSAFFERADSGELGFLSLSDVKNTFDPKKPAPPKAGDKPKAPTGPTKETLIRGLFTQEISSLKPGPAVGLILDNLLQAQIAGDVGTVEEAERFVLAYKEKEQL